MRRSVVGILSVGLAAGAAGIAYADEYNAPGDLGIDPGDDLERLERALEESAWRLGALRLDPWVSLREVAWVKPPNRDGDLTISVGAGLRAYLPIGSKVTVAAQVTPYYIWWQDRTEDRRLGGVYGAGLFYFSHRASVQATATSADLDDFITDEVDRRVEVDSSTYRLSAELPVTSRIGVFAAATRLDRTVTDTQPDDDDLAELSSVVDRLEGGLTWSIGSATTLRGGIGSSETRFDEAGKNADNDGEYWLVGIDWKRRKLGASVTLRANEQTGTDGSDFQGFSGTTWRGRLSWSPRSRWSVALYGLREIGYSADRDQTFYVGDRLGLRVGFPIGSRLGAGVFYEDGQREYEADGRIDDVTSWGGQTSLPIRRRIRLQLGGRSTETRTGAATRSFTEYRIGLSFGADHRGFF